MLPEVPGSSLQFNPNLSAYDVKLVSGGGGTPYYQTPVGRWVIRRIAQWAINCVDFRDTDSIMTPFEFDYYPWDGWNVDGNLGTDGVYSLEQGQLTAWTSTTNQRGVVWGMETPDLLITETLAFHDRRVKDTSVNKKRTNPVTGMTDDTASTGTLDQFRVPQGSLFVELYSPRATTWNGQLGNQKPQLPLELYNTSGQLILNLLSPPKPTGMPSTPDAEQSGPSGAWR